MFDIAIVEGSRTPFAKAFGELANVSAVELGKAATLAVLKKADLAPDSVDQVIFGNVVMPADAANIARVIALESGIPEDRIAHTVQRNCASGMESITTAAQLIQLGEAETLLVGGTESMSQVPLVYNEEATKKFFRLGRAKSLWQRVRTVLGFRPRHFKPIAALEQGLTDPVTGLIMGKTAENLVHDFDLTREEQDAYAVESHRRAVDAQQQGRLAEEITPLEHAGKTLTHDIGPREGQTVEALAKLRPLFAKPGTVTVGNSCMVTDGAVALVVMPGEKARSEGRPILGYLRGFAYAGCDPARMGLGPVFATSKLFAKLDLTLADIDLIELNEAFAAVVLANERAFASAEFCREKLGRDQPLGELQRDKLNVNGGAIALGHPVGATGSRLVLTLLKELRRRGLRRGLATLCIGGGQGGAVLVEAA